jgi:hypothetical protein
MRIFESSPVPGDSFQIWVSAISNVELWGSWDYKWITDDSSYYQVLSVRYSCWSQDLPCWSSQRPCPLPVLSGLSITTSVYCLGWIWKPKGKGLVWMGRYVMLEALSTACPLRSTSWSPETYPRTSLSCCWTLWLQRTHLCVTVHETQWWDFGVIPDTNLHAGALRTSMGHLTHN